MRKIKRTKKPTLKQMQNMARNLEHKFDKPSVIQLYAWGNSMSIPVYYNFYVESTYSDQNLTWAALQDRYFEVINDE